MHAEDRKLLARLERLNAHGLPRSVMELLDHQTGDGDLPPDGLRAMAEVFLDLAHQMRDRADDIDGGEHRGPAGSPVVSG